MLVRIPQHSCAYAELPLLCLENVMIDAALTSVPEGIVVGKLAEAHRHIAQGSIHFHHCIAARQAEYLGMRPTQTSQRESVVLDALRYAQALIVGVDDKAGSRDIMFVAPRVCGNEDARG